MNPHICPECGSSLPPSGSCGYCDYLSPAPLSKGAPVIHHLSQPETRWLRLANELLTRVTVAHAACCECELCRARMLTDVQDEESFHVPFIVDRATPPRSQA
jgi:hypothetical protein